MSRCAPYAVSCFAGITLDQSCTMFLGAGWDPDRGATMDMVHSVLSTLGIRSRIVRGAGLPSRGVVFVAGQTCHAIAVRDGRISDIKEHTDTPIRMWHGKHGTRYPRVVGCVEIY